MLDGIERQEVRSFDQDEVTGVLAAAAAAVDAAGVPLDLRVVAFEQAARMLGQKQVLLVQRESPVIPAPGPLRRH